MSDLNNYSVQDGIAVVIIDNPPINGLGSVVRPAIGAGIRKAAEDPQVKALVIMGSARAFSGGADIREFNTDKSRMSPTLPELNDMQDAFPKPMVAAIGGFALGGGLELALACHYRVALPKAQLGLPEVKLGVLPGSGGTQRLPRLIGAAEALKMITSGAPVMSERGKELGLIDELIEGDLREGAIAYARKLVAEGKGPRRVRDMTFRIDDPAAFFEAARADLRKTARHLPAPLEIVAAIEDALNLPFDEGRKIERQRFVKLVEGPVSKALRHMFFAERESSRVPDIPEDTPVRPFKSAAVIGAGTMGSGVAMCLANAGIPVTLVDTTQEGLDKGMAAMKRNYASTVSKGRLSQEDMDKRMALVTPALQLEAVKDADIVIEAVFERMDVKQDLFRKLDAIARPGAILASNTSTLDLNAIAAVTSRPQDVIGTHFFSPANVMRLLEVVRAEKTGKDVLATTLALAKKIRKVPVVAGVCDGFIGNRMMEKYGLHAWFLLDEGCTPQQVDRAMTEWGMAMGPFAMYDMAGLDVGWEIRKRRIAERPNFVYSKVVDRVCEAGRKGQKNGKGWYRYETGSRTPIADPELEQILVDYRKEIGITPREISDEEIVQRLILAMVNEGARILEEGIALRASDIDAVYLTGYGFPQFRGGPMFYADTVGLSEVLGTIGKFHRGYQGALWKPAPLLEKLAAEGKRFNGQ